MRRVAVLLIAAFRVFAPPLAPGCAPPPPVALAPSNPNLTPSPPVTFNWSAASPTPTGYEVFVDGNTSSPACLTPNVSCQLNSGVPAGQHTWIVRADRKSTRLNSSHRAL